MGRNMRFPESGVRTVTREELKAAFDEQCPVVHGGITYQRISALISRRNPGAPRPVLQVELADRNGNSVTIAAPDRIERSGSNAEI